MGRQAAAWLLLFFLGILLIVIGFTGKLGMVIAVAFTPGLLAIQNGGSGVSDFSTGGFSPAFTGQQTFPGGARAPLNVPNLG